MIKIIYVTDPEGGKLTMRAEGHAGYAGVQRCGGRTHLELHLSG